MGIIIKQSIKGTFISYSGVVLGFITVGLLWPKFLTSDQIGLINFILASATILAQLASLGINSVTIRLFPMFRNKEQKHHGFLFLLLAVSFIGFLIISFAFLLYKPTMVANNIEKSSLIVKYAWYILPFTLSLLYFNIFDNYTKVLYDAVSGILAKELLFRFFNLLIIVGIIFSFYSFDTFIHLYFIIFSLPTLYMLVLLIVRNEFSLKNDMAFIRRSNLKRGIISVSFFGLIGGFGTLAVANIDKLMINKYLDLSSTGIYSISILFATLVTIPSRSLGKISGTLIADAWKADDLKQVENIYSKSCINQMIIGLYIFMMIVLNLEALYTFLPDSYANGRYVIYFIGLASLFDMATGVNGIIISTSKYYRLQSLFVVSLFILVVVTNIIFIPRYGITGAAIASAISTFIYNLIRYLFLLVKFNLQPFNLKQILVPLGGIVLFLLVNSLLKFENLYLNVLIPSLVLTIAYGGFILAFRFSEDIQEISRQILFRKSEK